MAEHVKASVSEVYSIGRECRIYAFGAGKSILNQNALTPSYPLGKIIYEFIDNNPLKWNTKVDVYGNVSTIISLNDYIKKASQNDYLLITPIHYQDIEAQINRVKELNHIKYIILSEIYDYPDYMCNEDQLNSIYKGGIYIPKVIHYCWFGKKKIPYEYEHYIESWKKYCPDYEIVRWDESNYDITQNMYMKQAYENRMWGFVPDYARLDIIYRYGGFYLDTDVELIKSLDQLQHFHAFVGYESTQMIALGLGFGAEKGNPVIRGMRDDYSERKFIDSNGKMKLTPSPKYQTEYLQKQGLKRNNSLQQIENGNITSLPTDFLCGIRFYTKTKQITEHTVSLHHWSQNWGDDWKNRSKGI
ncbi:MAG: hypothetical protein LKF52_03960 [Butyrivibrio sp.]|jgi:mannosyltransferase OCH1-like enzyme|nr:hypothetical protein [Butyrivibrio sp.]